MCCFRVLGNTGSSTRAYAVQRGRGEARQCGCGQVVRGGVGGERERKEKVTSQ